MLVAPGLEEEECWVFAYFVGNGEDGLHLATSTDALTWTPVAGGRSLLQPQVGSQKLIRDPSLARGPDGVFHLVWTVSWNDRVIGHASSRDLIEWSEQEELPVMVHEFAARNAWAPEVYYDEPSRRFLIVWASTVAGRFPATAGSSEDEYNHRLYYTTTRDWRVFTPTKLLCDPGFSVIDGFVFRAGGKYVLVAKNERRYPEAAKWLFLAQARTLTGPYEPVNGAIDAAGTWVEGPCMLRVRGQFVLFFDRYSERRYGAVLSPNLARWTDITEQIDVPAGARHGTMVPISRVELERLRALR
ncbi:MAG: glycoside hydrolase family 43 protein [Planctomycetota bacterium]